MPDGIGEVLRQERLAQGIELADVEERTKIRVRYLRALENEDWESLPGDAYARGFLRTYGDLLGLDGLALAEEYRRLAPSVEPGGSAEPVIERRRPRPLPGEGGPGLSGRAIGGMVAAAIVAVLVVLGITNGGSSNEGSGGGAHSKPGGAHARTSTTTSSQPTEASVRLAPTADVWVCLVDQNGKPLVNGETLTAGDDRGPFHAAEMKLRLGNGELRLNVNGHDVPLPTSANPIGYDLTPSGARQIPDAAQPTCG